MKSVITKTKLCFGAMVSLYHDNIINYTKCSYGAQTIHKVHIDINLFNNKSIGTSRICMLTAQ